MPGQFIPSISAGIAQGITASLLSAADRQEPDPGDLMNAELWRDGAAWAIGRGLGGGLDARIGASVMTRSGSWELPDRSYGTPGYDEYKHLKHKTIPWNWATRITQLATATTLGAAARHDTAAITIRAPETAERVFESARLIMTFRMEATVGTVNITDTRMGIQIGSGPTVDMDRTFEGLTTTSRDYYAHVEHDVTDYVRRWFTGATATAVASIAVATSAAVNINNITFKLLITYAHAPTSGTRLKCIRIPIQSEVTSLTNVQTELGIGDGNPAPSGQIPALDTFLPELGKTYRQITLCLIGNDGLGAGITITPQLQIDATAEIPRATLDGTLQSTLTYYDQFELLGVITTNATHTVSMRCDTVVTNRLYWVGGWLEVVYEYDHASTLANNLAMYEALVPLTMGDGIGPGSGIYDSVGGGSFEMVDAQCLIADLDIHEPGTITLKQSAIVAYSAVSSSASPHRRQAGANQPQRINTPLTSMGPTRLIHRVDINNGWTLQRGRNRLPMFVWNQLGRTTTQVSYAIINYTAGIRVDVDNGAHPVNYNIDEMRPTNTSATALQMSRDHAYVRQPQLGTPYRILAAFVDIWNASTASLTWTYGVEQLNGEGDGLAGFGNGVILVSTNIAGNNIGSVYPLIFVLTSLYNRDNLHSGRIDIHKRRRQMIQSNTGPVLANVSQWITYHQHTYSMTGTVLVNGVAAPAGKNVEIWAKDPANFLTPADLVTTVKTVAGGGFSASVPDDTRTYFASYENDGNVGKSAYGTPDASTFDITIGSASSDPVKPVITIVSPAEGSTLLRTTPIVADVTDNGVLRRVFIYAVFPGQLAWEVVHDGEAFGPTFTGPANTRTSITGGYQFNLLRDGGWPASPELRIIPIDAGGNQG